MAVQFGEDVLAAAQPQLIVGVGVALFTIIELEKQIRLRAREMRAP